MVVDHSCAAARPEKKLAIGEKVSSQYWQKRLTNGYRHFGSFYIYSFLRTQPGVYSFISLFLEDAPNLRGGKVSQCGTFNTTLRLFSLQSATLNSCTF